MRRSIQQAPDETSDISSYASDFLRKDVIPFWDIDPPTVTLTAMGSAFPEEYRRFLKKLKAARLEAGLTQVDVAKRLRRPQSFVSKFETGERRVDPVELRHLADIYGKATNYFLE